MTIEKILQLAEAASIRLVRFGYCDLSGIIRAKAAHIDSLAERLCSGIGLVKGMLAMNMLDQLQTDTGLGTTDEVRLIGDPDTFTVLPYSPAGALVLCDLYELNQEPWALCPRTLLKQQLLRAEGMGIRFQAAFEPEFMLGSLEEGTFKPVDQSPGFSTAGMNRAAPFINRFAASLEAQNIRVEQYYSELGHGQHEVSIAHAGALEAADRHILYRETLHGLACEMGLAATMSPKPFINQPGNGCHLHLSAWDAESSTNLFASPSKLSRLGEHFVAGLLKHMSALVALTCPSVNSYRRLKPRSWSSAYTCWGYENREAAIRVPSTYWGREEATTNLEIKCVDATCNPYLALSAVIAAGLDGVKAEMEVPEPIDVDPSTLSADQLEKHKIRRLPINLKEALKRLLHDRVLMEMLGDRLARTYITVKTSEALAFGAKTAAFELRHHRMTF